MRWWTRVAAALPGVLATGGFAAALGVGAYGAVRLGLDAGSFLGGYAMAAGTLFLFTRGEVRAAAEEARRPADRRHEERQAAETAYSRWTARRARLECIRLRRELREDWRGDVP